MRRTSGDLSGVIRPVTELSHAVFLSYASQDAEAAQKICEALRAASIAVFFDQSELRGGDVWDQKIRREIHECTLFIPVISANTASRHEGYFRLEWDLADQRTHMMARSRVFVVPVCLDSTTQVAADVPESFQRAQWTRMLGGDAPPAFIERIKRLLSPELSPLSAVSGAAAPIAKPAPAPRMLMPMLLALFAAIVFAALAYFVINRYWLAHKNTASRTTAEPAAVTFNPPPRSIAVLPFVNLSGNKEQEYFSDGLSEELLNSLSRLNDLQVVARTSSFSFKGQNVDVSTIAHKLNVAAVLEGSVRPAGNTVRITVQLVNALNGFHIWSQTYDRRLSDILKVQTEVATAVAQELRGKLIGDQKAKLQLGGTENPEAHDAYLRGLQEANQSAALAAYDRAIAIDPDYAAAYVGKSSALLNRMISPSNLEERRHSQEQALATAQHAVSLAPDFGECSRNTCGGPIFLARFLWSSA